MADLWPVLFSLAQTSFAVALIRNGSRVERLLTEVRALHAEVAELRALSSWSGSNQAPTPAMCPKCGTRRVVLVNRPSEGFTRWACECGATGRWCPGSQSAVAPQPASHA